MVRALARFKSTLNYMVMIIASILTTILVFGAIWQVFSRYVLGAPSTFTEELLRFLLIWVAFLGATYAFGSNQHLAIVFLKNKLTGKKGVSLQIVIDVIVIIFIFTILVRGGYAIVDSTMGQLSPILRWPMGVIYAILPISGVLMIFYQLINIMERSKGYKVEENEDIAVLGSPDDREV
ncbi:TRAP transporter small permease [Salipaludibacillus agaradhaerens]|jgi:TRAP-type C4-dicarboxylate transport system permease small subunit|uniref:TRAP transporter small permease n=1 Tax=Salipaludibacillus agaradhaerens TaxID=76935 RepID=A0A9Q4B4M9_SALAG|nr:TRAP transporter small permease [Salipaludibacillus agaradhaerens]MCR6108947.1 TRAP transporter small permease [Bacillus sp. A301a_S52]UJW56137.1 TRAP transporter small permease [Bacillus sp. A116_S68]MCR6098263.1 TRAP transporter small permease [Salipaludibacillus agaradhaerens]MCR6104882.1 TRAP transporter small permease [Salipaludibacillus agaradhaerens]MCR6116107.1 TRAP transporter small permease [Salipaludibacillus agaradhaerens]